MKDRDSSKQTTEGKASENKLQIFEMFLFIRDLFLIRGKKKPRNSAEKFTTPKKCHSSSYCCAISWRCSRTSCDLLWRRQGGKKKKGKHHKFCFLSRRTYTHQNPSISNGIFMPFILTSERLAVTRSCERKLKFLTSSEASDFNPQQIQISSVADIPGC